MNDNEGMIFIVYIDFGYDGEQIQGIYTNEGLAREEYARVTRGPYGHIGARLAIAPLNVALEWWRISKAAERPKS